MTDDSQPLDDHTARCLEIIGEVLRRQPLHLYIPKPDGGYRRETLVDGHWVATSGNAFPGED